MLKSEKERVVEQLAERLRSTDTLMVADYRGLTMPEIDELRSRLLEAGPASRSSRTRSRGAPSSRPDHERARADRRPDRDRLPRGRRRPGRRCEGAERHGARTTTCS
jgi:hypothetical protein